MSSSKWYLAAALVIAAPGWAQEASENEPYRTSAQCAGVFEALRTFNPTEGMHGRLDIAVNAFLQASTVQATAGGMQAAGQVQAMYEYTRDEWVSLGVEAAQTEQFGGWMIMCRQFAEEQQIDLGFES